MTRFGPAHVWCCLTHDLFQSDVAVRAAEMSVPVVGPRLSNLPWLFGEHWAGLMDPGDTAGQWATQVETVVAAVLGRWSGVCSRPTTRLSRAGRTGPLDDRFRRQLAREST